VTSDFDNAWSTEVSAAETVMGEEVKVGNRVVTGVVDPIERYDRNSAGGKVALNAYNVHLSNENYVIAAPQKGTIVEVDGIRTRVGPIVSLGGAGWRLECVEENVRVDSFF